MADPLTSTIRLTKPTVGGDTGTWGGLLNSDCDYVDEAINQTVTVNVADTNFTLLADGSSSDQARYLVYNITGAWTADRTGTLPANQKVGWVINGTTGGHNVILSAGGTTLSVAPGTSWTFFSCDGTNVSAPPVAFGALKVLSGGINVTGNSTITGNATVTGNVINNNQAGYQVKDTGGTARTLMTIDGANNVNLSNGGAALWRVLSQSGSTLFSLNDAGNTFIGSGQNSNPISTQTAGIFINAAGQVNAYQSTVGTSFSIGCSSGSLVVFYNGNNVVVGSITYSGATTAYNTSSDARLKIDDGLIAADEASRIITALRPRWFRWKSDADAPRQPGFFAQQVHRVFPWAVQRGKGRPGGKAYIPWQMDAGKLLPVVIVELQALRRRVAELERGNR